MASAYAAAVLGDFHLGQDAAQEAFVEAYQRLGMLRNPGAFKYWLKLLIRKHCDRFARSRHSDVVVCDLNSQMRAPGDPVSALLAREEQRNLAGALSGLTESHRQTILLFYMGAYSHAEIADFLGVPAKTVKSRLHSARAQLKRRMLEMTEDVFETLRPSRDETFMERVQKLVMAVDCGDAAAVGEMLAGRSDLANATTSRPFWSGDLRALHVAVEQGDLGVVKALVENGAEVNAFSEQFGWTPLHLAIAKPEIAEYLIASGAEVDLFAACGLGDEERARTLLAENPSLVQIGGPDGATPLHFAANVSIADLLLGLRAEIEAPDAYHRSSPLAWAISSGRIAVADRLITHGATLDFLSACALNRPNVIAEFLVVNPELARMITPEHHILRSGFTATPLHIAARYGALDAARVLIAGGAGVTERSGDGSLAIHDAAFKGNLNVVRILLKHGTPVNDRETRFGATPVGVAQYAGHESVAAYLRRQGGV